MKSADLVTQNQENPPVVVAAVHFRWSRLYWLLGVIFLLLVAGIFLLFWQMVDVVAYRSQMIAALENITGRSVTLDKVVVSPMGGLFALELHNLEIHALGPAEPSLLLAQVVRVGVTPLSLLQKILMLPGYDRSSRFQLSSLTFIQSRINIQRNNTPLLQRAQEIVQAIDRNLLQEFDLGVMDVEIGALEIQNGHLTFLNLENTGSRTLVFEHIQASIHTFSASRAFPVSLAAQFLSIPFTLNGQVGPLPESLELLDLPVLLSLEAKSVSLPELHALFTSAFTQSARPLQVDASRGYVNTHINGSLRKGMRSTSRLELDKLIVSTAWQKPPQQEDQAEEWKTLTSMPQDWAVRQKSVLQVDHGAFSWQIEELFLYLDRKPILDIKGSVEQDEEAQLDVWVKTLEVVDLKPFATFLGPYLAGESGRGELHIYGSWPNSMTLSANLDLTRMAFQLGNSQEIKYLPWWAVNRPQPQ